MENEEKFNKAKDIAVTVIDVLFEKHENESVDTILLAFYFAMSGLAGASAQENAEGK